MKFITILLFNIIFKQLVMRMLKKFFLPAILFGTLLVSASIGFVSCSDDYDDAALTNDVSTLQTQLTALQTLQNSYATTADLESYATTAEMTTEDAATLASINQTINDYKTQINAAIASKVDASDLEAAVQAALPDLTSQLEDLGITLKAMLTDISIDTEHSTLSWYYGTVATDAKFGPNDEIELTAGQENNVLSMELYAHANPSNVDWDLYTLSLVNSAGEILPVIKFDTPVKNTAVWTKGATSTTSAINNIWKMTTTQDWSDVNNIEKDLYNNYMINKDSKEIIFYLAATDKTDPDFRISSYDNDPDNCITFDRKPFTTVSGLTLIPDNVENDFNSDVIFSLMDGGTPLIGSANHVYKKYITLTDPNEDADSFTGLNKLMDNDDIFTVQCINETEKNKYISFTAHYLNYNGTTGEASAEVIFPKLAYADSYVYLNSTIDFSKTYDKQISDPNDIADFKTLVGESISDYITNNVVSSIAVTAYEDVENNIKPMPSTGVLNFVNAAGNNIAIAPVASTIPESGITAAITDNLANISVSYSAADGQVDMVGKYGIELTFKNNNGNLINRLFIIMNVEAPSDLSVKLTTAWSLGFTQANVWAELNSTGTAATYNMNHSYSTVHPTSFAYIPTDGAMSFTNNVLSISAYSTIADRPDNNYKVTSTYNKFNPLFSTKWGVSAPFNIHMRSAVNEAHPSFPKDFNASLIYKNTADATKEVLEIGSIIAEDPSDNSEFIQYALGTTTLAPFDSRIAKITFTIVDNDPNATSTNNNTGAVRFAQGGLSRTIVAGENTNALTIESAFHADPTNAPASLDNDVLLQLQMEVLDVFGFTNTYTFDFNVKKNQTNVE